MWSDFSRASVFNPRGSVWIFPPWCNAEIINRTQHMEGFLHQYWRREQPQFTLCMLTFPRTCVQGALSVHSAAPHRPVLCSRAWHAKMKKMRSLWKFVLQTGIYLNSKQYFGRCAMIPSHVCAAFAHKCFSPINHWTVTMNGNEIPPVALKWSDIQLKKSHPASFCQILTLVICQRMALSFGKSATEFSEFPTQNGWEEQFLD